MRISDWSSDVCSSDLAHGAEMRGLRAFGRQGLVVVLLGRVGIEREIELVAPAELEPRPAERIVAQFRGRVALGEIGRSEEHTSELQSLMRSSYAVFCLKKKKKKKKHKENERSRTH